MSISMTVTTMPTKKQTAKPQTTAQQLAAIIKSARNIMRKDKGLNGDLDRLPMLTWVMFLKFLDDMERLRETEAQLAGTPFRPDIAPPYRWRDWAGPDSGLTGDDLIAFVNNDEAVRADGQRAAGLFYYLRGLQSANGSDRRDVIATVFRGMQNRMVDGYLLATVLLIFALGLYELFINKIDPAEQAGTSSSVLVITSLDDLKSRLAKVVLMILIVRYFERALSMAFHNALDLLLFAAGIALLGLALFLSHLADKNH